MNRRCRRGQHNLVTYHTVTTERYRFDYRECSRCTVRKAERSRR